MKPTIHFISENFKKFNAEYFNNELRTPHFEITKTKRVMGQFSWRYGIYTIRISAYYDREEYHLLSTLIHEMIHQYIRQNGIVDTRPHHGAVFYGIADRINKQGGWNIARCSTDNELSPTRTDKVYHLAAFRLPKEDNKCFIISMSERKVEYFRYYFADYKEYFKDVIMFTSTDSKYDRMNVCRTRIRGQYITEEEYLTIKANSDKAKKLRA